MRPKIKIMPAIVDFGSRGLTDPSFGRIGDGPETPPPDLGEALKKPLLSGPYKVLNPKFRGRSKVVKSNDPAAKDDCDPRREKLHFGAVFHARRQPLSEYWRAARQPYL